MHATMRVIQKVRFPTFYLNKTTTYRVAHEAEIQSHISFTSHIVTKSVWSLIIVIYQFVKSFIEKKSVLGM
jgi:hypothetical protein